jgi:hypothetical protein
MPAALIAPLHRRRRLSDTAWSNFAGLSPRPELAGTPWCPPRGRRDGTSPGIAAPATPTPGAGVRCLPNSTLSNSQPVGNSTQAAVLHRRNRSTLSIILQSAQERRILAVQPIHSNPAEAHPQRAVMANDLQGQLRLALETLRHARYSRLVSSPLVFHPVRRPLPTPFALGHRARPNWNWTENAAVPARHCPVTTSAIRSMFFLPACIKPLRHSFACPSKFRVRSRK